MTAVARDPHRVLSKTEVWMPAEQVRRLEPLGLVAAMRRPRNLDSASGRPLNVPDVRVEHTVDIYENRLVKLYHEQVALRLRRLAIVFEVNNQLAALAQIEELDQRLRLARREASFLDEVTLPRFPPTQLTMVFLRRAEYKSILEGYLEFHREAYVELDVPELEAPLDNLPDLYEMWGTLQVIDVLLTCGEELGYEIRVQNLVKHIGGALYLRILPSGEPAVVLVHPEDERVARLTPQVHFTGTSRPFRSISFRQRPDVTVEIERPGQDPSVYLFDPKYKLRSESVGTVPEEAEAGEPAEARLLPKKVDIDTMHAYRDAIRNAAGDRVVRYAAILYPGPSTTYGDRIEALSAVPSNAQSLRTELRTVLVDAMA
jgi:predicted component of viral defense system (DUF524 family)